MKAPTKPINKTAEAFKEPANVIGITSAAALAFALLNPVPVLAIAVVEAAYLLFVPDSKWFDQRLNDKYDADVIKRRMALKEKVFSTLNPDTQTRFSRLEVMRQGISQQTLEGKRYYREVLRKLDYLMEKFLLFASKEVQFQNYLDSVQQEVLAQSAAPAPPTIKSTSAKRRPTSSQLDANWVKDTVSSIQQAYEREIANIDNSRTQGDNLHNQAIMDKRREVLSRRKDYVSRIGDILENLGHQLLLMEDTFGLINDEIRARSPEQVLADVDDVVFQTDNLTETLQDIAPFEQMTVSA